MTAQSPATASPSPDPTPSPLAAFLPFTWAERELCAAAIEGRSAQALAVPPGHPDMAVRAAFLRCLLLERDPAVKLHERGFGLFRMHIAETLDLQGCELRRPLRFQDCLLSQVNVIGATLSTFSLSGGSVLRILGDRSVIAALFLRGVEVLAGARLMGAQIGGDLDCAAARLSASQPDFDDGRKEMNDFIAALSLDGATVGGAFFLRGTWVDGSISASSVAVGKLFDARKLTLRAGQLNLDSAIVGGDVDLSGAVLADEPGYAPSTFATTLTLSQAHVAGTLHLGTRFETDGEVNLNDLRVAGSLTIRGARFKGRREFALSCERMDVQGMFDLDSSTCFGPEAVRKADALGTNDSGRLAPRPKPGAEPVWPEPGSALDLTAATVGALSDQWAAWPVGNRILGFRYKTIAGATSIRADWWVDWLRRQMAEDLGPVPEGTKVLGEAGFKPQPWNQVQAALRDIGCVREAEDVAIAKEDAAHAFDAGWRRFRFRLWGKWAGYGYRPLRLLWALPIVYLLSALIYVLAAAAGIMAPTSEEFVAKAEFRRCKPEYGGNWSRCHLAPAYPDFFALAYAAQMLLPAIELRQSKDWAPVPWTRPVRPLPAEKPASAGAAALAASPASAAASPASVPARAAPASVEERDDGARLSWPGLGVLAWSWLEAALGLAAPVLVGLALTGLIRRKSQD